MNALFGLIDSPVGSDLTSRCRHHGQGRDDLFAVLLLEGEWLLLSPSVKSCSKVQ